MRTQSCAAIIVGTACWLTAFVVGGMSSRAWCQQGAVVVRLDARQRLVVEAIELAEDVPPAARTGLVVWSRDGEQEYWRWLDETSVWPPVEDVEEKSPALSLASRGVAATGGGGAMALQSTVQLTQLQGAIVLRGSAWMTPQHQGAVLSGQPTFRRVPMTNAAAPYPPASATLFASPRAELFKIHFANGQEAVRWSEIASLPSTFQKGLPPGKYSLRMEGGLEATEFSVVGEAERRTVEEWADEMEKLLAGDSPALAAQFRVDRLLAIRDAQGNPRYLADALDFLESLPEVKRNSYLTGLRLPLRQWLENLARDPGYRQAQVTGIPLDAPTGVELIDEARGAIAAGRWSEATKQLGRLVIPAEPMAARRVAGLRSLYEAVVAGEAGVGRQEQADAAFRLALEQLADAQPADRLRVHVNWGDHRLRQTQDMVHNHAFQIAAGVRLPFLSALRAWSDARANYEAALPLVQGPGDRAAVQLGLARCHALLADLLETLSPTAEGSTRYRECHARAAALADLQAREAEVVGAPPLVLGATHEVRAQLALRAAKWQECVQQANSARQIYERAGFLAGLESVYRLLGLQAVAAGELEEARRQFQISQLLAELLRERYPADELGVSRAGFFARRSYVYQNLVEISLALHRPEEALRYAELSKARSTRDLLTIAGQTGAGEGQVRTRSIPDVVAAWPAKTAAVEYFLGERVVWAFVVTPQGNVRAYLLRDSHGQPVAARDLVARVRALLSRTENQAARMAQGLLSGRGFDNGWQDELHRFYTELWPEELRRDLAGAEQVVVVPQHILHYFPFAAMVVRPDRVARKKTESVSPRFLIDEPYHLICSPSLQTWDLLRRRPSRPLDRAQAVGIVEVPGAPPLPGVAQDLRNFREVFGSAVKQVVEGEEATADQARRIVGEPGVLLIATHGYNEPDHPLDSYLLFLPAKEGAKGVSESMKEGRLTARDVLAMRVRANSVVMSACFSGLGDRSPLPGDDLFGLQRAFLQAGARNVVSGLWDVYDGTAPELILGFFRHLHAGEPASKALAQSQREFLAKLRQSTTPDVYLHPYFWAVYCVAGDDSAAAPQ